MFKLMLVFYIHCFHKENLSLFPSHLIFAERPLVRDKIKASASKGSHFCTQAHLSQRIVVFDRGRSIIGGPCPNNCGDTVKTKLLSFSYLENTSVREGEGSISKNAAQAVASEGVEQIILAVYPSLIANIDSRCRLLSANIANEGDLYGLSCFTLKQTILLLKANHRSDTGPGAGKLIGGPIQQHLRRQQ